MNRELLIEEAKLQEAALKRLGHWAAIGMAVSSVGVVLIYFAVAPAEKPNNYAKINIWTSNLLPSTPGWLQSE